MKARSVGFRPPAGTVVVALLGIGVASCGGMEPVEDHPELLEAEGDALSALAVSFTGVTIDANNPANPQAKTVGDLSGDGRVDVIVSSSSSGGLHWYEHSSTSSSFTKRTIRSSGSYSTDMQVADVDGDFDLDIVVPKDSVGLVWYKNPLPSGEPRTGSAWSENLIGSGVTAHDVEVGDMNRDGRIDVVTRKKHGGNTSVWLQNSPTSWRVSVATTRAGEGTSLGDIDRDGDLDILQNGFWMENADGAATSFIERTIDSNWPANVGNLVVDLNRNGRPDVVLAPSESGGRFSWYESSSPRSGPWTQHSIDSRVSYLHTFKAADADGDGDVDLLTAEMHQSANPDEVSIYESDGTGLTWSQRVVGTSGSHNLRLGDVGLDGDVDIVGSNWNESAPDSAIVRYWRNDSNPRRRLDAWQRRVIDSSRPWRALSITSADVDRDGRIDVLTGGWWYKNPGSPTGTWSRRTIGSPLNNLAAVFDFDRDGDIDILGTQGQGSSANANFAWARNNGSGTFTILTNVQAGDGDFLQGVAVGRFAYGAPVDVALSWHLAGKGIQMLRVPSNPSSSTWEWRRVSTSSQNEALSAGSISRDGDGRQDLLLGTTWLRNNGSDSWTSYTLFSTSGKPDRNRLADIDRDGRLDAVVGYEAVNVPGKLVWYRHPGGSGTSAWAERVISSSVVGPMSLDVADMDGDGDLDVVVGEHNLASPTSARLLVFENTNGMGGTWAQHLVYTGDEHHDGAHVVDLDGDGDLDIVSIGWGHGRVLWYENRAQ